MQMGSKPGTLHSPPPWNNTVLGVPLHIYNTYTIAHQNSKLQIYPTFNHLLGTFKTKPLGFHGPFLLVLSFLLILKSRNFAAISLIMFPHWVVPA